ncbi:MAG: hypothetical protein AAF514_15595, partial [Verrucomicrobiota bacterium]
MTLRFFLIVGCLSLGLTTSQGQAGNRALEIGSVSDMATAWSATQHVYVKGNVGVSVARLSNLEDWLDQHGRNWTVLLLQSAQGERFAASNGRTYRGMDAVEQMLGEELSNRTGFGDLQDPRTGQANGCVFVLFLQERKFSYFASETQDTRGLGDKAWVGKLDRAAIEAMRNGRRVTDAARNTVKLIEKEVTRSLRRAEERKKRAIREAAAARTQLQMTIRSLKSEIEGLEKQREDFRTLFPGAKGDLSSLDTNGLNQDLNRATLFLQNDQVADGRSSCQSIKTAINYWTSLYEEHHRNANWPARLARMKEETTVPPGDLTASRAFDRATTLVERGTSGYRNGDADYAESLSGA